MEQSDMKIKYLGPSASINVAPFGPHARGEEKEYPDDFGADLIATSKKQQFEVVAPPVGAGHARDLESTTESTENTEKQEAQGDKKPSSVKLPIDDCRLPIKNEAQSAPVKSPIINRKSKIKG